MKLTPLEVQLRSALGYCVQQLETVKPKSGVHASSLHADLDIARAALDACTRAEAAPAPVPQIVWAKDTQ